MSLSDWGVLTSIILGVGGVVALGIKWTIKHYLAELKPNGGGSLNDSIKLEILPLIKEVKEDMTDVKISVAKLEGKFEQHIKEGD